MADRRNTSRYTRDSRRDVTRPNTKSAHYTSRSTSRTCKVRSCRTWKELDTWGYCRNHRKSEFSNEEIYEKCKQCSEMVKDAHHGITCDKCSCWYHIECVGINIVQYKCMVQDAESGMFQWYCKACKKKCLEAVAKIDLLENQTRTLITKVTKLDERVNTIESKMADRVKENVRSQIEERCDIDKRKLNVIVMNMKESDAEAMNNGASKGSSWYTDAKKGKDTDYFCKMVNETLDMDISKREIKDLVRIGGKRSDGKPRLLKITFQELVVKREILGKAKLLKASKYSNIYINPDLTPDQRKRDSELRKALKTRRANGESNLIIRKGEIVLNKLQKIQEDENEDDISMADLESAKDSDSESELDADNESDDSINSEISLDDVTIELEETGDDNEKSNDSKETRENEAILDNIDVEDGDNTIDETVNPEQEETPNPKNNEKDSSENTEVANEGPKDQPSRMATRQKSCNKKSTST